MKKILNIVGARPQFIKAFITMKSLNNIKSSKNILLHTGQHFDYSMSKIFFKELNFQNTLININLKEKTNRLIRLAEIIKKLTNKIKTINPDLVIVYGDTDTTLAGSIISKRLNIKLMHIEAGLRSNVIEMPEEQNRIFTDHLSDYLVCPNKKSLKNCLSFQNKKYFNFGDVMYDSFIFYNKFINKKFILNFKKKNKIPKNYIFLTIHRDANSNVKKLKKFFKDISKQNNYFLWPVHPKINKLILRENIFIPKNIIYTKPLSYFETLASIKDSIFVITDSGGVQKETFFLKKKCFVLRNETEWSGLIKLNAIKLIGEDISKINNSRVFLKSKIISTKEFGDGKSTLKIAKLVKKILKIK